MTQSRYSAAGVDTGRTGDAVAAIVAVLKGLDLGRPSRAVLGSGHYANVIALDDRTGVAVCTDGVGSKVVVAEQLNRFDTVGIDCVAMNVNDAICVGAEPIAVVDYLAVERADPKICEQLAIGLRAGAQQAGVEIPGGELAELPQLLRGHPSPRGFDLVGTCIGVCELERVITGSRLAPGDLVVGLPSSGIHANGLTLARDALVDLAERPPGLGSSVGQALLEPTRIYTPAVTELTNAQIQPHGLFHITGGGLLNLLRLRTDIGYRIDAPLEVLPIFELIAERSGATTAEMFEVFNMGCGFCCVVSPGDADRALAALQARYPTAAIIGEVTTSPGRLELPSLGLAAIAGNGFVATEAPQSD